MGSTVNVTNFNLSGVQFVFQVILKLCHGLRYRRARTVAASEDERADPHFTAQVFVGDRFSRCAR